MPQWACVNGELMPAADARVSVFDAGFAQGVGLFEVVRVYSGSPFRLERHLDRLCDSARMLGWAAVPDVDDLAESVHRVVQATGAYEARVRLTVTPGAPPAADAGAPELTVVATAEPGGKYPDTVYRNGVTVTLADLRQNATDPTTGHKTTSYFARLAALRAAHAQGAFEALWLAPDDTLACGSLSSLFVVRDEQLLTPPLDTPIVPGITRATVIEIALARDIPVKETPLTVAEVQGADEVFLTSTMCELVPVVRIGRTPISEERPGETTRDLIVAYGERIDQECAHG